MYQKQASEVTRKVEQDALGKEKLEQEVQRLNEMLSHALEKVETEKMLREKVFVVGNTMLIPFRIMRIPTVSFHLKRKHLKQL